jgi:hypothetical protein
MHGKSHFESGTIEVQPAVGWTTTVTIPSVLPTQKSIEPTSSHVSHMAAEQNVTYYMDEIALGLRDIISDHTTGCPTNDHDNANRHDNFSHASEAASSTNASTSSSADMAAVGLPAGMLIFLNNSFPTYILVDHANASVIMWTSPSNTSDAASNDHFHKLVNNINTWLPYFEVVGILRLRNSQPSSVPILLIIT